MEQRRPMAWATAPGTTGQPGRYRRRSTRAEPGIERDAEIRGDAQLGGKSQGQPARAKIEQAVGTRCCCCIARIRRWSASRGAGDVIGVHDIGEILLGQRQGNLAAQRHAGRREVIEGFLIRADHAVKMNIASVKLHAGRRFSGLAASSGLGGGLGGCR